MDERDLTDRLRALGEQPVPPDVRDHHLRRLAAATPGAAPRQFGRLAVAAAAVVGFVAGSTGLAVAGALPDPAQDVAHDVLAVVQVDVPQGNRGACVSAAARDRSLTAAEKQAAKDACPKGGADPGRPDHAGGPGEAPGRTKHAGDPCRGRPPWAGPGIDQAERERLKAEHASARAQAGCPMDAEEAEDPAQPGG